MSEADLRKLLLDVRDTCDRWLQQIGTQSQAVPEWVRLKEAAETAHEVSAPAQASCCDNCGQQLVEWNGLYCLRCKWRPEKK